MAHHVELTDAINALRDQFGLQMRAGRDEGRDMMVDALKERLNLSDNDAKELVEVLEKAHAIRWVEVGDAQDVVIGAPTSGQGMPLGVEESYWQFGGA